MTPQQIREIEETSLNAWPALREVLHDGWVLRLANGYTRRSNSVTPLFAGTMDVRQKIRFCQDFYEQHRQPAIFKLTAASQPAELEPALAAMGFHSIPGAIVKLLDLDGIAGDADPRVREASVEEWSASIVQCGYVPPRHAATLRSIINAIAPARLIALLRDGDRVLASGLAVAQGPWLGLFDIATHPQFRRTGCATAMVASLLRWGKAKGARQAYLQVAPDNTHALNLYAKLGFRDGYEYRYWQRDQAGSEFVSAAI